MSGAVVDVEDYWDDAGGGSRLGPGDEGGEICCNLKVLSGQSYYRWRRDYEGLKTSRGKWMKDLSRLKKAVADLTLDKLILREALEGNY